MKILIAGDTHGNLEILERISFANQSVDLFLHTGDSQRNEYEINPFISVKGNNDYFYDYPEYRIIPTEVGNLLITHGHKKTLLTTNFLNKNKIKIVITGHTHCVKCFKDNDILFLNPGSALYPRDTTNGTYIILEISKDALTYQIMYL